MKVFLQRFGILLFGLLFVAGALKLAQDRLPFSVADMLKHSSSTRQQYLKYDKIFGNEKAFYILFEFQPDKIADTDLHSFIEQIYYELQNNKSVASLTSIKNLEYVEFLEHHVFLNSFFDKKGKINSAGQEHLKLDFWKNTFLTEDGRNFIVQGEFNQNSLDRDERFAVLRLEESLNRLADDHPEWKSHLIGTMVVNYYLYLDILLTQKVITPILLFLLSALLFFLFRSWAILLFSLSTILLAYATTIYFVYLIDGGVSGFTGFAIFFVLIVATSDLIHYFCSFIKTNTRNLDEKLIIVKNSIFKPCLLTTVTTMVGFSSLLFSDLVPIIKIGLYSSFGSLTCFLFTFYVLPRLIKSFQFDLFRPETLKKLDIKRAVGWAMKHSNVSISLAIFISVVLIYNISNLRVDDKFYDKFNQNHRLSIAVEKFSNSFHFLDTIEYVITPTDGDPLSEQNYMVLSEFEEHVGKVPGISSLKSHSKFYRYVSHRARGDLTPLGFKREQIKERVESFYNKMVQLDLLDDYYDEDTGVIRTLAFLKSPSFQEVQRVKNQILELYEGSFKDHFKIEFMGHAFLRSFVNEGLVLGILKSLGFGLVLIFAIFIFIFRDIKICILAILPNILPLLFIGGFMGLFNIEVESFLVLLVCITLGISVDDTIHFLHSFKLNQKKFKDLNEVIFKTLDETSSALVGTTLVFILSFPCFFLSDLKLYVQAGIYVILSLLVALMADLFLLPVLLTLLDKDKDKLGKP